MRPLQLELTAFGPYPRKQAIDFTELGGSDLFLIHGPTGAGKTSIFDGLTYALFGRLAGSRGVDRIRADRADKDLQTRVVFRFRMGELVYRVERTPEWERPKKRGEGTTRTPAEASLWCEGDGRPVATGATEVSKAIVDILGMDVDQFTQVALLPQGEFKRLLCADSRERELLLKRLFATDRYVDIENLLVERKKRLEARNDELKAHRSEVLGSETPQAIAGRLSEARARAEAAGARAAELRREGDAALKELVEARQVAARFTERDDARTTEAAASEAAKAAGVDRERLDRARAAERVRDRLDRVRQAEVDEAGRIRDEREAGEAEKAAEEQLERASALATAAEAGKPENARITARIAQLEHALPDLARLTALDAACTSAGKEAGAARATFERLAQDLEATERRIQALEDEGSKLRPVTADGATRLEASRSLGEALRAAREREKLHAEVVAHARASEEAIRTAENAMEAAARARGVAARLHAQREERLAAWMARTALHDGEACPVCGSLEHPAPARAEGHIPDEREVNDARERADALGRSAADAESAREVVAGLLGDLRRRLEEATAVESRPVADLEAEVAVASRRLAEARTAADRLTRVEEELSRLRSEAGQARVRRDQAGREASAAQESAAKADASRAELRRQLDALGAGPGAEEEVRKLRKELQEREGRAKAAEEARRVAGIRMTQAATHRSLARKAMGTAERALAEARDAAAAACTAEGFSGVAACAEALLLVAEQNGLQGTVDQRISAHLAARKRLDELESLLAGLSPPDVAASQAARDGMEKAAREAGEETVRFEEEAIGLAGRVSRLEELQVQSDDVAEKLKVVGHVAELVRGGNPKAMSLHRFVLAARLEEVAEAASERLTLMTKGRFRLLHDTSVARKNSAAGLSLVVEDTWTGTRDRPVGALSGGESFLASLSLALGLSDVVLRHSGGRRLDALFVDEGFGTLDEATLDVAIQALETLPQAGRLVGVISHVAELRRRIPARIEVTPTESGAVATVRPA